MADYTRFVKDLIGCAQMVCHTPEEANRLINNILEENPLKIFLAGGESITPERQDAVLEAGCRERLVSFYSGEGAIKRVTDAIDRFESKNQSEKKTD